MFEKRKLFQLSDEVRRIVAKLQHAEEEQLFTYEELSQTALADVRSKNWIIQSALNILAKDHGLEFVCVREIGYQRISDADKIRKINQYNRKAYNSAKRGVRVSRNTCFERLTDEEKSAFNKQSVLSYLISGFGMIKNQNMLVKSVTVDPKQLTQKEVDTASAVIQQFGKDV